MAHSPRAPPSSRWQLAYLAGDRLIKIAHLDHPAQSPQSEGAEWKTANKGGLPFFPIQAPSMFVAAGGQVP
jgi:hypothetical protein